MKRLPAVFVGAALLLSGSGCGDDPAAKTTRSPYEGVMIGDEQLDAGTPDGPSPTARSDQVAQPAAEDWGDDWGRPRPDPAPGGGAGTSGRGTPGSTGRTTEWTIVLGTFGTGAHQQAAATMIRELPSIAPELSAARVHTTQKGSLVVYGAYESAQSATAQDDLTWIKQLQLNERVVFPRAMLTRVHFDDPIRMHRYHLMSARRRYPKVDPLYTLQIASWGDFESGQLTVTEIKGEAESYVERLRTQGVEAYFYHDDDKEMSIVTVGLFDRNAIDLRSGFYAPEVLALMKRYPAHLVNGEPLNEMIDRNRPHLGTKVQAPRLVHVPE